MTDVVVTAPARLHFGVLDLRGDLGRRFGGIGAAVPAPSLLLEARPAAELRAEGPDAARALEFARRFARHHGLDLRLHFCLHRSIPTHAGLGSGTQLALAVARASAELSGLPTDVTALARAVDRGRRSGVGTWTFAYGGLVLEGGRTAGAERVAPLLARLPFPDTWRCVVAVPHGKPGLAGDDEAAAFARLPSPSARDVERALPTTLEIERSSVKEAATPCSPSRLGCTLDLCPVPISVYGMHYEDFSPAPVSCARCARRSWRPGAGHEGRYQRD